jgi:hypothetical protein
MQRLADYYVANRTQFPIMIWRDNSPQHFDIANGKRTAAFLYFGIRNVPAWLP